MLEQEIKLYDEPARVVVTTSTRYASYPNYELYNSDDWYDYQGGKLFNYDEELSLAKATVKIGDKYKYKNSDTIITIVGFVEDKSKITKYGNKGVILGVRSSKWYQTDIEYQYTTDEFLDNSMIRVDDTPKLIGSNQCSS